MVLLKKVFIFTILIGSLATAVSAQETQTKVVDEVVAQVNDSVITLSRDRTQETYGLCESRKIRTDGTQRCLRSSPPARPTCKLAG